MTLWVFFLFSLRIPGIKNNILFPFQKGFSHGYEELFFGLTLPVRASGELSCSSLKSWPKVGGLEHPAAAELWLPPSASSTGTTVKLVGMLTPGELWERVQRAATRRHRSHVWTFKPPQERKRGPEEEKRRCLHVVGEWGIQNEALTPAYSLPCWSSVLLHSGVKLLRSASEAKQSPAVSSFTFSVPFPPFSNLPPTPALLCLTTAIAPCDPLFTILTQGSSHGWLLPLSPLSCPKARKQSAVRETVFQGKKRGEKE